MVQNAWYSNGPPSHLALPFEYQTSILSGISMNPVFGIQMVLFLFQMKLAQVLMTSGQKRRLVFRDLEEPSIQLDQTFNGFVMNRTPICQAQDIKTFWKLSKDSVANPLTKVMTKTYF